MQCIVDVPAAWWIHAADGQLSEILPALPETFSSAEKHGRKSGSTLLRSCPAPVHGAAGALLKVGCSWVL